MALFAISRDPVSFKMNKGGKNLDKENWVTC